MENPSMFIQKPYCMRMPSSNQRHVQKKKGKACRKGNVVEQIVEQVWIGQQEEREPKTPKRNLYKSSDLIRAFCG
jgi:hypothetical protein